MKIINAMFRKSNPKSSLSVVSDYSPLVEKEQISSDGSVIVKHVDYESVVDELPTYQEYTLETLIANGTSLNEVPSVIICNGNQSTIISDDSVNHFSDYLEENVIVPDVSN